jgi:hypothetical protein
MNGGSDLGKEHNCALLTLSGNINRHNFLDWTQENETAIDGSSELFFQQQRVATKLNDVIFPDTSLAGFEIDREKSVR